MRRTLFARALSSAPARAAAPAPSRSAWTDRSALIRRAASTQVPPSEQPAASPDTNESPQLKTPEQAPQMTDEERHITDKLRKHFDGAEVAVQDVSGGCGSFFAVSIVHSSFKGLSVVKQHQLVNRILADDVKQWHGVQLKTKAP